MSKSNHYAIVIVLACLLLYICTIGLGVTSLSVYFPFIRSEYGMTNTQVSLINTVRNASATLFLPLMRIYYSRFSLRTGMTISLLISAAGFLLLFGAKGPILMYVAATALGLSFASGTTLPITLLLSNWFTRHISIAFGLITAGSGLAVLIGSPVIVAYINRVGLSGTYLRESMFVIGCAVVFFFIVRERPVGEEAVNPRKGKQENADSRIYSNQVSSRKSISFNFIIFAIASFLVGTFSSICITSYTMHFSISGYSSGAIAAFMSIYGLALIPSKITYGILADRFRGSKINIIYFGLFLTGIIFVLIQGRPFLLLALLYITAVSIGLGNGITTAGMAVWATDLSTKAYLERNVRVSQSTFSAGLIAGSTITGVLADATGDYSASFISAAVMICVSFIAIQYLYKKGCVD